VQLLDPRTQAGLQVTSIAAGDGVLWLAVA
jgi:hypothetical protein